MNCRRWIILSLCLIVFACSPGSANSINQTLNITVASITEMSLTGSPVSLTVQTAAAGDEPDSSEQSMTYNISSNRANFKLTAALNSAAPADTTVEMQAAAPGGTLGGTSAGFVPLSTTAQNVVSSLNPGYRTAITVTFRFTAPVISGIIASTSRDVTITLTAGP
ncbi:MAG: hypothetical protein RDV48_28050 [Candidatus Eremiobacteraeota bacterium]|nr:hypothetical protein [Candidatus Eremiobacteraeota bacterium]